MNNFSTSQIPAVVINLTRHPDRLTWFLNQAMQAGITVERIDAVDANDPGTIDDLKSIEANGALLSNAELACIMSHRKAWQQLIDSPHDYIAIFEDDVYLSKDTPSLLSQDFAALGVNILNLESPIGKVCYRHTAETEICGRTIHRLLTKAYGAAGYIISRNCAQRLLVISQHCSEPVDVILFDDKSPITKDFLVFQIIPAACIQDNVMSLMLGRQGRFESAIAIISKDDQDRRKTARKKNRSIISCRKFFQYLRCIRNGAKIFGQRDYVPFDLGSPSIK